MKMRQSLTPRQSECLAHFKRYCRRHEHQTPTYNELAFLMGCRQPTVFAIVEELIKKGYLVKTRESGSRLLALAEEAQ